MSKNKCRQCGSGQTYVRIETQQRVCRICGAIKPLKTRKKAIPIDPTPSPEVTL